jgi:hypothetical protein
MEAESNASDEEWEPAATSRPRRRIVSYLTVTLHKHDFLITLLPIFDILGSVISMAYFSWHSSFYLLSN